MRLLSEDPSVSTREIASRVGISNGAAHYCVIALIDNGYVKLKNFAKYKSKSEYLYELTPKGLRQKAILTVRFLKLKRKEYDDLRLEIVRLENELGHEREDVPKYDGASL